MLPSGAELGHNQVQIRYKLYAMHRIAKCSRRGLPPTRVPNQEQHLLDRISLFLGLANRAIYVLRIYE